MQKPPALIGYRATGKTSVGTILADLLGCKCVDTDAEIVRKAGCSIAEIFATRGESTFRDLECVVVEEVTRRKDVVISFGGGVVVREENRRTIIGRCHPVVWLQATAETIDRRIHGDQASREQRPKLTQQGGLDEIRLVLQQRRELYEACATLVLDSEVHAPDQIAQLVFEAIGEK